MSAQLTTLNQFWLAYLDQLAGDIPEEALSRRPGHGNSPLWIYGHLALCVDFGLAVLGDPLEHPRWVPVFGPGSSGDISRPDRYDSAEFLRIIAEGYPQLCARTAEADSNLLAEPHDVEFLKSSPVKSKGDFLAHLLTTHLAFHTAQLSRCRREAGAGVLV